jgi:hypothetical protein
LPNFVASTTRSRARFRTGPTSVSFSPMPYMSALSKKVTPSSIARSNVATDSSSLRPL